MTSPNMVHDRCREQLVRAVEIMRGIKDMQGAHSRHPQIEQMIARLEMRLQ